MNFNPRAWPHPVLSPLVDDIDSGPFDFELKAVVDHDRWRITTDATLQDPTVTSLIASGSAGYLLHLECRRTFYRTVFPSIVANWEVTVPGPELFGQVEASLIVVAKKDVDEYKHPAQHADYNGGTFNVAIGEPFAVAETQVFDAFNEPDMLRQLSSILNIRKDDSVTHMQVICEAERIIAVLPSEEYFNYVALRGGGKLMSGVLANAVVLPALLQSLHYLRKLDDVALSEFKTSHRWSRLILTKLDEMGIDVLNGSEDGAACLLGAQRLLHGPLRRSLADLHSLLEDPDQ